jgi:hypothetical protein
LILLSILTLDLTGMADYSVSVFGILPGTTSRARGSSGAQLFIRQSVEIFNRPERRPESGTSTPGGTIK